jgi:protein TonB
MGIEGTTLLKIRISEDGLVEEVIVARSAGHAALDQAALDAVQRWRFEPARRGDHPVGVWVSLPVRFRLE